MEKEQIAGELLSNTKNHYLKSMISEYIENIRNIENGKCNGIDNLIRFDNCISYIKSVNFDIRDWMIFEIPIFYSHCFWNTRTKQAFDLAVWDIGEVIPRYLDEDSNEQDADTIEEAIEKYYIKDYIRAGR